MLLVPWPVCFMDWWIWTWNLLHAQAWFKKPTLCSLSHGKEKNTSESLEIQRGLHDISVLITLFLLMTLKPTIIDLPDHLHYLTYLSLFTCQSRSLCSFISKSLSTVGQGRRMHPRSLPKTCSVQHYCHGVDVNIEYICVYDNTRPTNKSCLLWHFDPRLIWSPTAQATKLLFLPKGVV
jgi:hypothetical protein